MCDFVGAHTQNYVSDDGSILGARTSDTAHKS